MAGKLRQAQFDTLNKRVENANHLQSRAELKRLQVSDNRERQSLNGFKPRKRYRGGGGSGAEGSLIIRGCNGGLGEVLVKDWNVACLLFKLDASLKHSLADFVLKSENW